MKIENIKRIVVELKNEYDYELSCGGCPTIFEFKDTDGHKLHFRLRYGCWRLYDETLGETLASGSTNKHDGVCDWDEAIDMMRDEGVCFKYGE